MNQNQTDNQTPKGDDNECEGHESLRGADMGVTVFCDGSCVVTR